MSGSLAIIAAMPVRTTGWSSAVITRIVMCLKVGARTNGAIPPMGAIAGWLTLPGDRDHGDAGGFARRCRFDVGAAGLVLPARRGAPGGRRGLHRVSGDNDRVGTHLRRALPRLENQLPVFGFEREAQGLDVDDPELFVRAIGSHVREDFDLVGGAFRRKSLVGRGAGHGGAGEEERGDKG